MSSLWPDNVWCLGVSVRWYLWRICLFTMHISKQKRCGCRLGLKLRFGAALVQFDCQCQAQVKAGSKIACQNLGNVNSTVWTEESLLLC